MCCPGQTNAGNPVHDRVRGRPPCACARRGCSSRATPSSCAATSRAAFNTGLHPLQALQTNTPRLQGQMQHILCARSKRVLCTLESTPTKAIVAASRAAAAPVRRLVGVCVDEVDRLGSSRQELPCRPSHQQRRAEHCEQLHTRNSKALKRQRVCRLMWQRPKRARTCVKGGLHRQNCRGTDADQQYTSRCSCNRATCTAFGPTRGVQHCSVGSSPKQRAQRSRLA